MYNNINNVIIQIEIKIMQVHICLFIHMVVTTSITNNYNYYANTCKASCNF